jgi:uncharacterized protein YjbJ (UPF0337 family)
MTSPDDTQRTVGGLAGKAVGKVKEALAHATDSDTLAREGRLQQAQSEAGLEAEDASRAVRGGEARGGVQERAAEVHAERDRLANQVAAEQREH